MEALKKFQVAVGLIVIAYYIIIFTLIAIYFVYSKKRAQKNELNIQATKKGKKLSKLRIAAIIADIILLILFIIFIIFCIHELDEYDTYPDVLLVYIIIFMALSLAPILSIVALVIRDNSEINEQISLIAMIANIILLIPVLLSTVNEIEDDIARGLRLVFPSTYLIHFTAILAPLLSLIALFSKPGTSKALQEKHKIEEQKSEN